MDSSTLHFRHVHFQQYACLASFFISFVSYVSLLNANTCSEVPDGIPHSVPGKTSLHLCWVFCFVANYTTHIFYTSTMKLNLLQTTRINFYNTSIWILVFIPQKYWWPFPIRRLQLRPYRCFAFQFFLTYKQICKNVKNCSRHKAHSTGRHSLKPSSIYLHKQHIQIQVPHNLFLKLLLESKTESKLVKQQSSMQRYYLHFGYIRIKYV